jgi:phosphoglycerate dehydrogenase-like enzyme
MLAGPAALQLTALAERIPEVAFRSVASRAALLEAIPRADAVLMPSPAYDAAVRDALVASPVRLLHGLTAGFEEFGAVGVPAGVTACNAGDAWSPAVAEQAVTLLLAVSRRLPVAVDQQRAHRWDRAYADAATGQFDRVLVIVGLGRIGRRVAVVARALGMRVVGVNWSGAPDPAADEIVPIELLDEALGAADAVVVAVPHDPSTARLFDAERFAAMKAGAVLVNVARGAVVDTSALVAALRSGHLAGAGLDVVDPEPLPADHPIWDAPNVLITPHAAGSAGDAGWNRIAAVVAGNVARLARGEALEHVVVAGSAAS